jgi:hypothetical protein
MRTRTFTLVAVLALLVAACGQGGSAEETTTTTSAPPETAAAPEAMLLSYSLEEGQTFTYEVDMDQHIDMTAEGDTSSLGEDDIPGEMSLTVQGTTTLTHTVEAGPEPGTFAIHITGDLSGLTFSGEMDGEPVTQDDVPDFAGSDPVDVTVIVDEQGNVIPEQNGLGDDLFGGLGGMDMLNQFGPGAGADAGQFVGPPFSEDEVTVGDTWSESIEIPTLPGSDPITTKVDSEVLRADVVEGHDVFVIQTDTSTSEVQFDLADILVGFLTAFVPDDASDEDRAQIDEMASQLRFAFSIDPQASEMTTWFDYEAGVARQAEFTTNTHMVMDVNVPNEDTGEMASMAMDMTIAQNIGFRLTDSGSA